MVKTSIIFPYSMACYNGRQSTPSLTTLAIIALALFHHKYAARTTFLLALFHHKFTALVQEHFIWNSLDTSLQFFFAGLLYTTGTLRNAQAIPFQFASPPAQPQNVLLKTLAYNTRLHGCKRKRVSAWISTLIAVYSPSDRCSLHSMLLFETYFILIVVYNIYKSNDH